MWGQRQTTDARLTLHLRHTPVTATRWVCRRCALCHADCTLLACFMSRADGLRFSATLTLKNKARSQQAPHLMPGSDGEADAL